jgi:hypothetical protein
MGMAEARRAAAMWRESELKVLLTKLLASDKLHTGAAFAAGAVAFALANLLLAHHLQPAVYGIVALMVAIAAVGGPLAPLGLAIMVVRDRTPADRRLLLYCAGTSTVVAVGSATVGAVAYGLTPAEIVVVAVAVGGGGFVRLASGVLQSEERFIASTLVSESANYLLLAAALITFATGITSALWPFALVAVAQLLLAGAVWTSLMAEQKAAQKPPASMRISEMMLLTGTAAATLIQTQAERFAIPMFLNLESLAAFAVLAVFTIAPFRPLEFSTYRTLFPKLRRPGTGIERRALFMKEVAQTAVVMLAIGLGIAVVTPLVLTYLFGGKYHFSIGAVLAGVVGGQLRVARSLLAAAISALADKQGLAFWTVASWLSVGAAFLGGWVGSAWGFEGFLWGVALGWVANIALTVPVVVPHLR